MDVMKNARFEGLKAAIRLVPAGYAAASVYAALIFILFGCHFDDVWMVVGVSGTFATALFGLPVWIMDSRRGYTDTFFLRVRYIAFNALLSLFVTLYLWQTVQYARDEVLMFAGIIMFAFMTSGGLALCTYTPVQLAWLIFPAVGTCGMVLRYAQGLALPFLIMFVVYVAMVVFFSIHISKMFYERIAAQANMEHQSEVMRKLLNDFEDKAHDWLIEISAQGVLRHASSNFAAAVGRSVEELYSMTFYDLMVSLVVSPEIYKETYQRQKRDRLPIHDQLLEVNTGGQHRWWLSSGKPIYTNQGEYDGWRFIGRDITEQKLHEEKIAWQAAHDIFTGLYNRYHFLGLVKDSFREPGLQALLLIDLVSFRTISTIHGQAAGDTIIHETGRRLQSFVKHEGFAARMSGSEFAVLLSADKRLRLLDQCSRIMIALSRPIKLSGVSASMEVCAGIAMTASDIPDAESLVQCADLALTAAKAEGVGVLRAYDPHLTEQYLHRLLLIEDIDRALKRGEFQLWYQPLVSAITGSFIGAEALIRWAHPKRGMIMPGSFIPAAEQSGKITAIGAWVIRQACTDAAVWKQPWRVSVNVSAEQFKSGDLVRVVRDALSASNLPPSRLVIEITESVLIESQAHVLETLHSLNGLGVSIALDDFGSGFSSLRYLQTFPIQELKIDQSFVRPILSAAEPVPIIETIIVLAKKLGLKTTGEGVETPVQAGLLKALGCDQFQGYLYSKPIPQSEILLLQGGS